MKPTNEISKQVGEVHKTVAQWWNDPLIIQLIIAVAGLVVAHSKNILIPSK